MIQDCIVGAARENLAIMFVSLLPRLDLSSRLTAPSQLQYVPTSRVPCAPALLSQAEVKCTTSKRGLPPNPRFSSREHRTGHAVHGLLAEVLRRGKRRWKRHPVTRRSLLGAAMWRIARIVSQLVGVTVCSPVFDVSISIYIILYA